MAFHYSWALAFGLLGNIVSCLVGLAPLPTFYKIYKKKTSEGFQSLPYVVALFSAMLWMYYALLKKDALFLITINSFFCIIEAAYIAFYFFYAPKKERLVTIKLFLLFNIFGFGLIGLITYYFTHGTKRLQILGYICMSFALAVFVAPLGIVKKVIKTKSVEYMPFTLSFFLTLSAVFWFLYGVLIKDLNVAVPNVLGFIFGILQMVLYMIYRKPSEVKLEEAKVQELAEHIVDVKKLNTMVNQEMNAVVVVEEQTVVKKLVVVGDEEIKKIGNDGGSTNV